MPIHIINRGPQTEDPGGERNYDVKINHKHIVSFKHCRRDGLAVCLERAAKAVREKRLEEIIKERAGKCE